jgi:hypothetical protein
MKKAIKLATAAAICLAGTTSVHAFSHDKLTLKGNMSIEYTQLPKSVETVGEAFTEGMVYGRLRANFFKWDWDRAGAVDNKANGIGGSLVYKTAPLNGVSGTLGLYTTQNLEIWRQDKDEVGSVKAGKDTFDRAKIRNGSGANTYDGHYGMTALGQAYLQYDFDKTSVKLGRQMFETVFTKSNDTKMIPNTFDGITVETKAVPDTKIQAAYFTAQKLRDHTDAHDVIAFNSWYENDDSAINKSLTPAVVGTDNELIIVEANNKSIKNAKLKVAYALVPDVVANLTLEGHYKIPVGEWSITPGVRYMKQMDKLGATGVSVANRAVNTTGYTDADSLDGGLFAARLDFANGGPFKMRLGYSSIEDKADIIAPWRGFATGGFTRAMAQYNWDANTDTTMIRFDYDFGKAGMVQDLKGLIRYAMQDFDDNKPGVQADSDIIHIDLVKKLAPGLEGKVRVGLVDADPGTSGKTDVSYNEYRVELNYFF